MMKNTMRRIVFFLVLNALFTGNLTGQTQVPIDPGTPTPIDPIDPIGPIDPIDPLEKCYYPDMDGDTYGDANADSVCLTILQSIPIGHVENNEDCDDDDATVTVGQFIFYKDNDGDGFGGQKASDILRACENIQPDGYVRNNRDINDFTEPCVLPPCPKLPPNNCESQYMITLYQDLDRDGYGSSFEFLSCVSQVEGYANNNSDCNDFDPEVTIKRWFSDQDGDGFGDPKGLLLNSPDGNWNSCRGLAGYVDNNLDQCPDEYGEFKGCLIEDSKEDFNTIKSLSYDINGNLISANKSYYDELGKSLQTQTFDKKTKKIWATQSLYDEQGRAVLQTLSGSIRNTKLFEYKNDIIKKGDNTPITVSDLGTLITDPFEVSNATNTVGWYYSNANTRESLQDVTSRPYSRSFYSELNPGNVLKTVGGNKIDGQWKQGYSFTMPAAQELSQSGAFSDTKYNNYNVLKTVVRDVHGIESVVFTDTDGNTLAAARSGNQEKASLPTRNMTLTIGAQGFTDVHIPVGCSGITVSGTGASSIIIHDLITELPVTTAKSSLPAGFYRISVPNPDHYTADAITIGYQENYYDYSLNEYDKAGRLISSKQPLHKLESTYTYNTLGQLLFTESPDEGKAWFKYRKDGQIRYSQNSKQKDVDEFSYTNYDNRARPIQSGVIENENFDSEDLDPDGDLPSGVTKEVVHTKYDFLDEEYEFLSEHVPEAYRNPSFLAGNVSRTWNGNTSTYYSYDIYGRVQWILQDIEGLGVKTIDYEYDAVTSAVTKVYYQKGHATEQFIHKYTYNPDDYSLTKVETSTNNTSYEEHATYEYYETGALKRVNLAEGLQGIDYVYNLNGALKSINHPSLTAANDPGGDSDDIFGMNIHYYKDDYSRTNTPKPVPTTTNGIDQYNGNIKAITWNIRNQNGTIPNSYYYKYNRNNWLEGASFNETIGTAEGVHPIETRAKLVTISETLEATQEILLKPGFEIKGSSSLVFSAKINSGGTIDATGDYNVSGITYDANGNIKTLNRNKDTYQGKNEMDKLLYAYKTDKPNQLLRVDDAVTAATNADDIKDQEGSNYVYNEIGQLIENIEEEIKYFYNASGLVSEIKKNNVPLIKFFYSDKGQRLRKEAYNPSTGALDYKEYYVRDAAGSPMAIYRNSTLLEHAVYGASRLGVYKRSTGVTSYELTDHLGNVRAIVEKGSTEPKGATDYYPFGMPMPNRNLTTNQYRYGYQGQEVDPETGKPAFQLRLWDSRIGRWLTTDPAGVGYSPYIGMVNNPISEIDPDGACPCSQCPENCGGDAGNPNVFDEGSLGTVCIGCGVSGGSWGSDAISYGSFENSFSGSTTYYQKLWPEFANMDYNQMIDHYEQNYGDYNRLLQEALNIEARAEEQRRLAMHLMNFGRTVENMSTVMSFNAKVPSFRIGGRIGPAKFTVATKKYDYFFGRVNNTRSAQNARDLKALGITKPKQLAKVFDDAFMKGRVHNIITNNHGKTIVRRIGIGNNGQAIDVGFFYPNGGGLSKVTTLIPKL